MGGRGGFRWRRDAWEPTTAQERVLDALSAGLTNAAIAARLGLSSETVKWHVAQLLAESGCADREALARWWQARRGRHAGMAAALAGSVRIAGVVGIAAVAVVAALVLAGWIGGGDRPPSEPRESGDPDAGARPAGEMLDLGRLIEAAGGALEVENRAGAAVVRLPAGGVLDTGPLGGSCGPPCPPRLRGDVIVDGRVLTVAVAHHTVPLERFEPLGAGRFRIAPTGANDASTVLMVSVIDQEGLLRRATIDGRGHLLVDPDLPLGDLAIDYPSGERLDVSGMRRLGRLPPAQRLFGEFSFTLCEGSTCRLSYRVNRLVAPTDGVVRCLAGERGLELESGGVRLRFVPITGYAVPSCADRPAVAAGDLLSEYNAHFLVSALADSGEPLSVAVSLDGTVYVGQVMPPSVCPPCRLVWS